MIKWYPKMLAHTGQGSRKYVPNPPRQVHRAKNGFGGGKQPMLLATGKHHCPIKLRIMGGDKLSLRQNRPEAWPCFFEAWFFKKILATDTMDLGVIEKRSVGLDP